MTSVMFGMATRTFIAIENATGTGRVRGFCRFMKAIESTLRRELKAALAQRFGYFRQYGSMCRSWSSVI